MYISDSTKKLTYQDAPPLSSTTPTPSTCHHLPLCPSNNQQSGYVTGSDQTDSTVVTLTQDAPTVNATTGVVTAMDIVAAWLDTEFEGGRHQRRVDLLNNY